MQKISGILILTSMVLLTSCLGSRTSFTKQKYTSLKHIKIETVNSDLNTDKDKLEEHHYFGTDLSETNFPEPEEVKENKSSKSYSRTENDQFDLEDFPSENVPAYDESKVGGNNDVQYLKPKKGKKSIRKKKRQIPRWLNITLLIISIFLFLLGILAYFAVPINGIILGILGLCGILLCSILLKKSKQENRVKANVKGWHVVLGVLFCILAGLALFLAIITFDIGGPEMGVVFLILGLALLVLAIYLFSGVSENKSQNKGNKDSKKNWGIILVVLGIIVAILGGLSIMAVSAYYIPICIILFGLLLTIWGGVLIKKSNDSTK